MKNKLNKKIKKVDVANTKCSYLNESERYREGEGEREREGERGRERNGDKQASSSLLTLLFSFQRQPDVEYKPQ